MITFLVVAGVALALTGVCLFLAPSLVLTEWSGPVGAGLSLIGVALVLTAALVGGAQEGARYRDACRAAGGVPIPAARSGTICARSDGPGYIDIKENK